MPTYTSSPQKTDLQVYTFKAADIDAAGVVDTIGTPGRAYALSVENQDGSARYFAMWDATAVDWTAAEFSVRVPASTHLTVHVDNGFLFSTAGTMAGANNVDGVGSPTSLDIIMFAVAL